MRAKVYLALNRLSNRVLSPAPLLHASRAGPLAGPPHQPIARAGRARKPIAGSAGQAAVSVLNRPLINAGQSLLGIKPPIQPRIESKVYLALNRLFNPLLINTGQSVFGIKPSIELPIDECGPKFIWYFKVYLA